MVAGSHLVSLSLFIHVAFSIQKKKKKINAYMPAIVSLRNLPELMCNE